MVSDHGLCLFGVVAAVHGPVVGELCRVSWSPRPPRGLERPRRAVVGCPEEVGWTAGLVGDRWSHSCHGGAAAREQLHQVRTTELGLERRLEVGAHRGGDRPHCSLLG